MLLVLTVAAAAALVVAAYARLRQHAPESGAAGLRAVRDLADVVIVCFRAIEGVLDVLARPTPVSAGANGSAVSTRYDGWHRPVDDASDEEVTDYDAEYDADEVSGYGDEDDLP